MSARVLRYTTIANEIKKSVFSTRITKMAPVDLTKLSRDEFEKFLSSFDHVFSDCDGVIWTKEVLPGSGKFFELMKKRGKSTYFVSNNSCRTKENYEAQFAAANIKNGFENLTIPSSAIVKYLKSKNFNKKIYCVTCPETIRVLEENGLQCVYGPDVSPSNDVDFMEFQKDDPEIGAVVFDSDYRVNLAKLHKALTYLKRPEVIFISGSTDRHIPSNAGTLLLATGVFTEITIEESNRAPIQIAKPGKDFGDLAMKRAGVTDPSRVLFIGDMICQDIGLGKATGFHTLLVLTNVTKEGMLKSELKPDYYAPSLGSIVPQFDKLCNGMSKIN